MDARPGRTYIGGPTAPSLPPQAMGPSSFPMDIPRRPRAGWTSWAGTVRAEPAELAAPRSVAELGSLITRVAERGGTVRPVGSGRSWTPLPATDDVMVSVDQLGGTVRISADGRQVRCPAGTTVRALASRLAAPEGMSAVEFATLRARALNALGEHVVARALVQDIDTANYSPSLTNAAIDAYIGSADIVGACPAVRLVETPRDDAQWQMLAGICNAYAGEATRAQNDLRRLLSRTEEDRIDVLLAQRFAGSAGRGRRAVTIEWDDTGTLTPWRFAMANALGEPVPEALLEDAAPELLRTAALTPALTPVQRARGADIAASSGILSSSAMVDLYSQIFAEEGVQGDAAITASRLREAYVGADPLRRLSAIRDIWSGGGDYSYGRMVLTAFAAARLPVAEEIGEEADGLIASMLAAGLDGDAMRWASQVDNGSEAWALLALANPSSAALVSGGELDSFVDDDESARQHKSRMLLAGLAGLERIASADVAQFSERLAVDFAAPTRWTRLIDRAAEVDNAALVAMLAGLGMQGEGWDRMTARHLFHIVSALRRVGLEAEARMIAAEAVARA